MSYITQLLDSVGTISMTSFILPLGPVNYTIISFPSCQAYFWYAIEDSGIKI